MSFNIRLDIDPVIVCPYDKSHRIARSRIQRHLVKCEKNFPPDYKQECPYDATHRLFEHEMIDHVSSCPMKFSYVDQDTLKISQKEPELEVELRNDDVWDGEYAKKANNYPFDEPLLEEIEVKQYTNFASIRGNSMVAKRYDTKLRRPFGYSQSMMLNVSNQSLEDDTQSITSDMGIGRGQAILGTSRGQNTRGVGRLYRRGFRGRLLH